MSIRAIIFDVYGTLITLGPPPADAEAQWESLWRNTLAIKPRMDLATFRGLASAAVSRIHAAAHAAGTAYPEVVWPEIVCEIISELEAMPEADVDNFIVDLAGVLHTSRLVHGAAEVLHQLSALPLVLGLASNAQAYTLVELDRCLAAVGLSRRIFNPQLCFFSFQHGYAKPDPRVFRLLADRLRAWEIRPPETLMVGNRPDNDIKPARTQGWQAWQMTDATAPRTESGGDWNQFLQHLGSLSPGHEQAQTT